MKRYHVTFYYCATGMEGNSDTKDYGVVSAESKEHAIRQTLAAYFPKDRKNWGFIGGCLTAKDIS